MDVSVSEATWGANAAVVWANFFQFAPAEIITNRSVESRALIWGKTGSGQIETDGLTVDLRPARFVFTRWLHDISYRANGRDPFLVGAVHLVPWHDTSVPIELGAAHGRRSLLPHLHNTAAYRRDASWPDLHGTLYGTADAADQILMLANLTVDYIQGERPESACLRALGVLLVKQLQTTYTRQRSVKNEVPPRLARMQAFIDSHLSQPLTIAMVAAASDVSISSAERLFRRHTATSVGKWITSRRIVTAANLLRTTNLPVSSIALAVGFTDPAYFSRVFRREHGISPRAYAAQCRPAGAIP